MLILQKRVRRIFLPASQTLPYLLGVAVALQLSQARRYRMWSAFISQAECLLNLGTKLQTSTSLGEEMV